MDLERAKTIISLIAAMGEGRVIGVDNALPWRLPADLRHFKELTLGKPMIMGRKTHESIGRPLPGRTNLIVTGNPEFRAEGCRVVFSVEAALAEVKAAPEVMVIGGVSLYEKLLPRADRLYLTLIHAHFQGDAFFPAYALDQWRVVQRSDHRPDERNPYPYSFLRLDRIVR